ncbi:MAG: alpha/beta fold hydrolase [Steroidobacterales bacterium]
MSCEYREFNYQSVDGLALFCREYRPAAPAGTVVCLPGLTRNSRDFTAIARGLARRYRVLTPDLRGRGFSQWDPNWTNYQPPLYYQDVLKLIRESAEEPVALIGTSLGGILAMALAATVPAQVAGIVINDVGPEVNAGGLARIGQYVGLRAAPGTWPEALAHAKANYASAYSDLDEAGWLEYTKACYRENAQGVVVADYDPKIGDALRAAQGVTSDLWPVWAMLAAKPVLAIRGAHSDILTAATLDRMAREKPDLEQIEVANRGHAPLLNEPGVLPKIEAFFAKLFP